jgi:predicted nucleic acid-binding protein
MSFVVDASVVLAWAFDEVHPRAVLARDRVRGEEIVVPSVWWFEVRNALVMGERRGRITERDTADFLRSLSRLPVTIDRVPKETEMLMLARRHRLTVYDAAYLELSIREDLQLATLDRELCAAARGEGILLIGD